MSELSADKWIAGLGHDLESGLAIQSSGEQVADLGMPIDDQYACIHLPMPVPKLFSPAVYAFVGRHLISTDG